ncbi:oxygen-dependent coproporphyrinogen oxidase [Nodularia spumigena CS-584]|jgi:coproporphyrinogen III oxidase|uniref:coproporphyrinogen oxidase n=1 Tax=Nodularia spumigena UHCC 0060 TaxID=3110300 RepID=A0ABU5URA7_NODSP|nr:oxygen-dependent coproporphyrinogen oxidase [Nodularia spumigena]AHJ27790.1 Coproporphyrinogen III oxidase, aerobic [Nodularia spumigena CCY9414]EAW43259.1 coproporphyrinogen III oxidase [Nodularia spumigena CCY9414]MDB9383221.1 oxygen-dependent coproporphyrinogen oxidase [Nodularia spumigena CS-584]MEA5526783.1 oxygen-dependent coproporphyrinogen oxidase [Nodularia spumigena UHCC 0143]MEA5555364.1 oxygen-dependent coproporphyrinogen oxidase [Nodularia spumigena CH309]
MNHVLEKYLTQQPTMRGVIDKFFRQMFDNTCQALESLDGKKFSEQSWNRDRKGLWTVGKSSEDAIYIDRVLHNGNVLEKVGVNYVAIDGELPPGMSFEKSGALATGAADKMTTSKGNRFFATGSSFVIHPHNPMAPTAHVNYRYFEIRNANQPVYWWFGGGADLTPAYLFEEDAVHFHQVHKDVCDQYSSAYYPRFKNACDEYFYIPHRGEHRGVGGIFFDNLNHDNPEKLLSLVTNCADAFLPAYMPILETRKDMSFTEENKYWQHLVRGRYVEFILSCDRGIRFGLASGMVKQQSVFNCMPPAANWEYDDQPIPGSKEAMLKEVLRSPRNWL